MAITLACIGACKRKTASVDREDPARSSEATTAERVASESSAGLRILGEVPAFSLTAQDGPLFASHDLVAVTIRAPFQEIFEYRGEESEEYPGVVVPSTGSQATPGL